MHPFPKTIRLEGRNSQAKFTLKNIGNSEQISVADISVTSGHDPDNLISSIFPQSGTIDSDGLAVDVSLNINDLDSGKTYSAMIDITDSGGNKEHVFAVYKYIGDVYVVAFDAFSLKPVEFVLTSYKNGYEYSIDDLPEGNYIIGASTDRNGDKILFQTGEVFGFFTTISNQIIINLNESTALLDVDFQIVDELL